MDLVGYFYKTVWEYKQQKCILRKKVGCLLELNVKPRSHDWCI